MVAIANQLILLLDDFLEPPDSRLFANPIVKRAHDYPAISRSFGTKLFAGLGAKNLICDAFILVDAGITANRRIWIEYEYASLTDFDGRERYTEFFALATAIVKDEIINMHFGFDWKLGSEPKRHNFDVCEERLNKKILQQKFWRRLHARETPRLAK